MTTPWLPGQRAIIDRRTVVTIDRVTPSGRAVVGDRTFHASGHRIRGGGLLEPLTPEIEAELALVERGNEATRDAWRELTLAEKWLRLNFSSWGGRIPEAADVDRAERLAAAIRQVMEGVG
jgi:hypothetical protein